MRSLVLVLAALLIVPAAALHAQERPEPGDRVRLQLEPQPRSVEGLVPPQELRGELIAATADSLTLRIHPGAGPITVATGSVRRMWVSRGIASRGENALKWGAVGAALGALEFPLMDRNARDPLFSTDEQAMIWGAAAGGAGGVIMGLLVPRERWKRVRVDDARVTVAPAGDRGVGVGLSLKF